MTNKLEHGQSLIEIANGVIILALLIFGMVDIGRVFIAYVSLIEGSQEGVLYGLLNPTDTSGITSRVRTSSTSPVDLSNTTEVSVSVNTIGAACAENLIEVGVTYNFKFVTPLIGLVTGFQEFPLTAKTSGAILAPEC